jgi:hypothetical protein
MIAACGAAMIASCAPLQQMNPRPKNAQSGALGEVTTGAKIGPTQLSLDQVQVEVEAFADRYVAHVSQATNRAARDNPEARERLHAVKLAVGRGAYTIAAGPNAVVSMLDMIVQATLVRHSVEGNLAKSLSPEAGQDLLSVFVQLEAEAWAIGERVLSPQDLADLRTLIETWIQENPGVVYVANIRLSDFSRMRPREGKSLPKNIFGLLRLDPFSSIDPAAREMEEARLLAERMFFYLQRLPQLLTWQTESLYLELVGARESQQLLTSIDQFNTTSKRLADSVEQLPAQFQEQLSRSEQTVGSLLTHLDESMERASQTLAQVDQTAANLREMTDAVTEAGRAWEGTANAVNEVATTLNPPNDAATPPGDPVTVRDVTAALEEAQATAVELRQLLSEFNAIARTGTLEGSVSASLAEARRGAQSIVMTITVGAVVVIASIVAGAIIYRAVTSRWMVPHDAPRPREVRS